jgi:predicted nucleotidyltransferase
MIFTKTEIRAMELFASRILGSFTIREVSRLIKKDLKIVHTSIKLLMKKGFLIEEKNGLRLNYKASIQDIAYIENIRKESFLKKNPLIKNHVEGFIKKSKNKLFVLIVFGSYASGKQTKKSDIDLLAIIPKYDEGFEREINARLSLSKDRFHINVIDQESFREMIDKREETNVINETLNNHILLYGAEGYYSLLGERDVR